MSRSFRHFDIGSRILYGADCLDQLPAELRRVGARRAVIICGNTIARSDPGLERVRDALGELFAGAFTGVTEQSPLPSVETAARLLSDFDADAVVAIGGGSAVVTARAATILHGEGGSIPDLCTVFTPGDPPRSPRLAKPKLPQFVVATTPTTAFAKSGAAVTLPEDGRRLALFDPKARAQALFVDPAFLRATPWRLMLDASLDAFAQGMQGLESTRREPLADALLLHGVQLIRRALNDARDGASDTARRDLLMAAQLIGQGTDFTGAGMTSALGHALGARCSIGNGQAKAVVLQHTLVFNAPATEGRLDDLAHALGAGGNSAAEIAVACAAFFAELGVPRRLRDLGVARDALSLVAADAVQDWFLTQNPRPVVEEDLLAVLDAAW